VIPDVTGMGAKDAVYLLERRGLKVRLHGRGAVKSQSYPAGRDIVAGSECILTLK
jgi:cell division protein FtsI (penicillin-binding protein 3)